MSAWIEGLGDDSVVMLAGLGIGFWFGACAQQSKFCLRSAALEFWRGRFVPSLTVWLLVFTVALLSTQYLLWADMLDKTDIRQLTGTGSLSGAIIGGCMFGAGMILARGCASRLLVLSATGNVRALVTGLVLTVVAQTSLTGILSPGRETLSSVYLVSDEFRDLAHFLPIAMVQVLAFAVLLAAVFLGLRTSTGNARMLISALLGLSIAGGWGLTSWLSGWSFEPVTVQSITFTGPSANTLMTVINEPTFARTFGTGLVVGVFSGSALAAIVTGQFKLQVFDTNSGTLRYFIGAVLMGFGGMLAGGCAVGAGITGGSVLALTSWVALLFMWLAAGMTMLIVEKEPSIQPQGVNLR